MSELSSHSPLSPESWWPWKTTEIAVKTKQPSNLRKRQNAAVIFPKSSSKITALIWPVLQFFCNSHSQGLSLFNLSLRLCMCMHAKSLQSCPTLCDPMDCSPPGSSVHGILQARKLEWVAMHSSSKSSNPGIKPVSPESLFTQYYFLEGHGLTSEAAAWDGDDSWRK